eukprot:TRINITY_DN1730_c0_g4_i2.p1 TRINITY_DN1730_c0_g4~~TRINITY_DN1730_c0_g4_i2.p1  ORF type:complete len:752 (+),score=262.44 TRINITY_DN1730_c0_g4_i2:115-2370(+)
MAMLKRSVVASAILLGSAVASGEEAKKCGAEGCTLEEEEFSAQRVSLLQSKVYPHNNTEGKDVAAVQEGGNLCPGEPEAWPEKPTTPLQHNGVKWPGQCIEKRSEYHFFLFGDYGGMTCGSVNNTHDPNAWACGRRQKHLFAKTADNTKDHPDRGRWMHHGIDDKAQKLVASKMQHWANKLKPDYVLSGGDNFYFGGIDGWGLHCCHPMDSIHKRTMAQFKHVFEDMYAGAGLDGIPFYSVLGNHDFGGRMFTAAWDQQIAYTWAEGESATKRWIMPGLYYMTSIKYPGDDFSIDVFMLDTNKGDAKPWTHDAGHNICGTFNGGGSSCSKCGGPPSRYDCQKWFDKLWDAQSDWLSKELEKSTADWQIIVTHFPPDQFQGRYWKKMYVKYGIDLFVGSHRHSQELHMKDRRFGGLNYVVCGGGGGITSEWNPDGGHRGQQQYGFMDVKVTKEKMVVSSINFEGRVIGTGEITPRPKQGELSCKHYGCGSTLYWQGCMCNEDCWKHGNCCKDFSETCKQFARCEVWGCNSRFDKRKPCQCTKDCEQHSSCCEDHAEKCKPSCGDNYKCGAGERWQACSCAADCWHRHNCCENFSEKCTELASCKEYGCFGKFERNRPCQCTEDCAEKGNCCSDFEGKCNTPEYKEAKASCEKACTIEGEDGEYSCKERIEFAWHKKHKPLEDAMSTVNEECKDQCECKAEFMKSSSSLLQETDEERAALNAKKEALLEELEQIENDLQEEEFGAEDNDLLDN